MLDATPLLRFYARRRMRTLAGQDARQTQHDQLIRLVGEAADTRFGRDHDFAGIRDVAGFRSRVPLRTFDDLWSDYWSDPFPTLVDCTWPGKVPFFAETSGTTTGRTKHIPCTHEMNRSNTVAAMDILVHHLQNRPRSRLLGGRNFMLGGSTGLRELAPGVATGDLSGIAAGVMPWWARMRYFPPRRLEAIADWEEKIDAFARAAIDVDIRSISGTPSWLLVLFDRLTTLRPASGGRVVELFPHLEMIVHGAVNFGPYRRAFGERLEGSGAETREVYATSEGFISVADRGDGEGMRLIVDNGLFYEFVPVEELESSTPGRHLLPDVEIGVNYAIVLSTCAGLWGYILGDTVEFVDRDPPRIRITGRTAYMLSAFGEHLIAIEIEDAVSAAAAAIDARVTDYTVGPVFPDAREAKGGHLFIVEFGEAVPAAADLARFVGVIDESLARTNEDYRAHRAAMVAPRIHAAPPGTFFAWMKRRGQLGGQHKVPRIINDPSLFGDLRDFVSSPRVD